MVKFKCYEQKNKTISYSIKVDIPILEKVPESGEFFQNGKVFHTDEVKHFTLSIKKYKYFAVHVYVTENEQLKKLDLHLVAVEK